LVFLLIVNGIAKPGQLTALMGASGAGKTTLLNTLTFRNANKLKITGDVKINGKRIRNSNEISLISGHVQQDDLFVSTLKVKEHLTFQAMLRLDLSTEEKYQRIEKILIDVIYFNFKNEIRIFFV
jgi:ATP-binding cassette, subfamily G (WHITE), eye pigment precursor transporter